MKNALTTTSSIICKRITTGTIIRSVLTTITEIAIASGSVSAAVTMLAVLYGTYKVIRWIMN